MELHKNESIAWRGRTSWKGMYAFFIKWGLLGSIVLIGGVLFGPVFGLIENMPWTEIVVLTVFLWTVVGIAAWFQRVYTIYTVTTHRININSGILAKRNHNCRLDRIQNANCEQGLIQRILDVGTIELETAGQEDSNFYFRGVDKPNALIAMIESEMEDRVSEHKRDTGEGLN
jgi:uncharacterized membrane protein YdbT with pleckstrin-like domain